jgi:hypothetical protein
MTNIITQFMPGFTQGTTEMQQALMWVAALLCVLGLWSRIHPRMSEDEIGFLIVRLGIVVLVISNITAIGTAINNLALAVTNATGFNQNLNMFQDYQTALVTKFKIINQPGNNNPMQWVTAGVDMIGATLLSASIFFFSMMACGMMFFVSAAQQIFFLLEVAMSPMFLACIMVPPLVSIATRWATFFVAVCIFPMGFRIVDLLMKGVLDMAVNTSGNTGVTALNAAGGSVFWWILAAVIAFVGYPASAFFIGWSIVSSGSHGLGVLRAAIQGMAWGAIGGSMTAARMGGSVANAVAGSQASPSSIPQPYQNYATRP